LSTTFFIQRFLFFHKNVFLTFFILGVNGFTSIGETANRRHFGDGLQPRETRSSLIALVMQSGQ